MTVFVHNNQFHQRMNFDLRSENRYTLHPQGLRRCASCNEIKSLSDFSSKGKARPGHRKDSSCKTCKNIRNRAYRLKVKEDIETYAPTLVAQLRYRSKVLGVDFDIDGEHLIAQWYKQAGLCYYTQAPLELSTQVTIQHCPAREFPSVDRLIPHLGYVRDNIVWTSWVINRMKNDLTYDEFVNFCQMVIQCHTPE